MANILNLDRRARLLLVCLKEFRSTPNRCGCRRPPPGAHARTDRSPGKGVTNPLGRLLIDYFLRTQFSSTTKSHVRALCADNGCSPERSKEELAMTLSARNIALTFIGGF